MILGDRDLRKLLHTNKVFNLLQNLPLNSSIRGFLEFPERALKAPERILKVPERSLKVPARSLKVPERSLRLNLSLSWSGVFEQFKNPESIVWCPLAMEQRPS